MDLQIGRVASLTVACATNFDVEFLNGSRDELILCYYMALIIDYNSCVAMRRIK